MKVLAENKRAFHNYEILERFNAGISLLGQEVKSIRTRGVGLAGSYVIIRQNEVFWVGAKISPYQPKNAPPDYNPERSRKLLLNKSEIKYLIGKSRQRGLTLLPLKVYTKGSKIKLEIGLARGRRKVDKRERIKRREFERKRKILLKIRGRTA